VKVVEKCFVYDEPMIVYEQWGSFLPDKKGTDTVTTTVEAGVKISEKVLKLQADGICTVENAVDGSKVITYKGINRGAYLCLGDLQQAVIHILGEIQNSASMKRLLENANI
jgi:beta-glucosidase